MFAITKSLGLRIFALSVILLILPLFIDSFVLFQRERNEAIRNAKDNLIEVANLKELALSNVEAISNDFLNIMLNYLKLEENFPSGPDAALTASLDIWSKKAEVFGIFIIGIQDGVKKIFASNIPSLIGKDLNTVIITKDMNLDEDFVSQIAFDHNSATPFFFITKTIKDPKTSNIKGYLLVTDIMNLTEKLESLLYVEKGLFFVNFAYLDENKFVIAASDPTLQLNYFEPLEREKIKKIINKHFFHADDNLISMLPGEPITIIPGLVTPPLFAFQWQDDVKIGYIKKIPDSRYSLLAYASRDKILINPMGNHLDIYTTYLAILIIGSTLSYFIVKRMAKPISDLAKVMKNIQDGKLETRYQKDPLGFEINSLGEIFNTMVESLIENQQRTATERITKEAYLQELKMGQQAQLSLLPQKMPTIQGIEIAERYIPAVEVGGDFYDVFVLNKNGEECVYLIIADASGKGVRACFYSLSARSMLRTYAQHYDAIDEVMHATNTLFCNDVGDTGMFITAVAAIYHTQTGELEYYFAGHNPAFIRRKDGKIETLHLDGIAMGLIPLGIGKAKKIKLEQGDLLLLYTDGVTEAHNIHQQLFGEQRLLKIIKENDLSAAEFVDKLVKEVNDFASGRLQHDDITLVAMKIGERND